MYFLGTDPMHANPPTTRFSCRPAISEMVPMDLVFEVCNSKLLPSLACTFVPASYPSAVCQFPVVPSILETVQNMLSFLKVTKMCKHLDP